MTVAPPEQDVVDTHVHFWDRRATDLAYAWLDGPDAEATLGDLDGLRAVRYSVPELRAETRMHGVTQVVHMAAATSAPLAETRWLQGLGDATGWPDAIVATCDLASPDAAAELERHAEHDRLRGLRDMRPGSVLADAGFRRGYARLAGTGLVFCHTVGVDHVAAALDLVRTFPDVVLCVDQSGMPESRDAGYLATWRAALATLAGEPNVVCKISSLGVHDHDWSVEGRRPWVRALVDVFGPERCLYGSNWPVERLYSGYGDALGAFRAAIDDLNPGEQAAVLAGNARRVFRLRAPAHPATAAPPAEHSRPRPATAPVPTPGGNPR